MIFFFFFLSGMEAGKVATKFIATKLIAEERGWQAKRPHQQGPREPKQRERRLNG